VTPGLRIEPLSDHHERAKFSCGVAALDGYFRERVTQDMKRRMSNCFVICDDAGNIAGFYTFAATSLPLDELSDAEKKRLPRYGVLPGGLIGRLAIDLRFRGQKLGAALVIDAALRASKADPAIFALIVDAKDEDAIGFYQHLGFRRFTSKPLSLFLTVATALQVIK
jgi:ribosomal protein S18 acetylase RimI-like enzyme